MLTLLRDLGFSLYAKEIVNILTHFSVVLQVMEGGKDLSEKLDTNASPDDGYADITDNERCSNGKRAADVSSQPADNSEVSVGVLNNDASVLAVPFHENIGKRKVLKPGNMTLGNSAPGSDDFQGSAVKKQKKISSSDGVSVSSEGPPDSDLVSGTNIMHPDSSHDNELQKNTEHVLNESIQHTCPDSVACDENNEAIENEVNDFIDTPVMKQSSNSRKGQVDGALSSCEWKPIEKELYLKGIEIFGKNRYMILSST